MKEEQQSLNQLRLNKEYLDLYFSLPMKIGMRKLQFKFSRQIKEAFLFIYYRQYGELIHRFSRRSGIGKSGFENNRLGECYKEDFEKNYNVDHKVVVYTAVFGNQIAINQPLYRNPNYKYFIFTDQKLDEWSLWEKKDITPYLKELRELDNAARNRWFKLHPHILFPEYDYSVYIDGTIILMADVMPMVNAMENKILGTHKLNAPVECVYESAKSVLHAKKAPRENVKKQMGYYKSLGYPSNNGMFENGFLIRRHNDSLCVKIMDEWWKEMKKFTMRDQLSLNFVLWRNQIPSEKILILGDNIYHNPRFRFSNLKPYNADKL